VRVDQQNQNSNETIPPVVHIEISVPGHKEIVVAHEADHLQRKYQTPDLQNAINEGCSFTDYALIGDLDTAALVSSRDSRQLFSLFSNDFQNLPATSRDTVATCNTSFAACVRRTSRTLSYDWMSNGYLSPFPVR
jgi:hypothetical protein